MAKDIFIIRGKYFSDPSDYLNNVRFKVAVPNHVLKLPKCIEEEEVKISWLSEINPNNFTVSYFTISELLKFYNKEIPFRILSNFDIYKIYKYIQLYIENVKRLEEQGNNFRENYRRYFNLLINFKSIIKTMLDKIVKTDPGIKERMESEYLSLDNILNEFG